MRNDSLRIGDAERDAAIAALARHFADGRLTQDEHEERIARALRARTGADLRVLFADLPRLDQPAAVQRRGPSSQVMLSSIGSALLVVAGVLLMLHLLPFVALIAFAFIFGRVFLGARCGGSGRARRADWHDNPWRGGGYYRR
ncbi:MAG TPA: DUF1707 domain-containing protein [Acidothermaceae bacterium]|jgi:hypothetical protein